jgi:uncharacterized protein
MTLAIHAPSTHSAEARRVLEAEGGAFLLCDWLDVVFVHFAVTPSALQPQIPFELDVRDGLAYVSAVAFDMKRMRLANAGRLAAWLASPLGNHGFLNLRTYVRHEGETGIYFLAEWMPNLINRIAAPRTYGLPYRWGELTYKHDDEADSFTGRVVPVFGPGVLTYRGIRDGGAEESTAEAGSLDEFLLERYSAFTRERSVSRRFRVWHEPWRIIPLDLHLSDTTLLEQTGPWFNEATHVGSAYSPGVRDVWMSRPVCVNGPACGRDWSMTLPPRPNAAASGTGEAS